MEGEERGPDEREGGRGGRGMEGPDGGKTGERMGNGVWGGRDSAGEGQIRYVFIEGEEAIQVKLSAGSRGRLRPCPRLRPPQPLSIET